MKARIDSLQDYFGMVGLPIGWTRNLPNTQLQTNDGLLVHMSAVWSSKNFSQKMFLLIGWIITAVALSLGASFWFDMLNKVMNFRNAGSKKVLSPETTS